MAVRKTRGFTLIELLVVICIIALLAALLLPALVKALCSGRQGRTQHLIMSLKEAAKMYESDQNAYPPGDSSGSKGLAISLQSIGPKKQMYFEFTDGMIDSASGNIWSYVHPGVDYIYYRNNAVNWPGNQTDPTAHSKQSFDIFAADCNNILNGVNSWD